MRYKNAPLNTEWRLPRFDPPPQVCNHVLANLSIIRDWKRRVIRVYATEYVSEYETRNVYYEYNLIGKLIKKHVLNACDMGYEVTIQSKNFTFQPLEGTCLQPAPEAARDEYLRLTFSISVDEIIVYTQAYIDDELRAVQYTYGCDGRLIVRDVGLPVSHDATGASFWRKRWLRLQEYLLRCKSKLVNWRQILLPLWR